MTCSPSWCSPHVAPSWRVIGYLSSAQTSGSSHLRWELIANTSASSLLGFLSSSLQSLHCHIYPCKHWGFQNHAPWLRESHLLSGGFFSVCRDPRSFQPSAFLEPFLITQKFSALAYNPTQPSLFREWATNCCQKTNTERAGMPGGWIPSRCVFLWRSLISLSQTLFLDKLLSFCFTKFLSIND